MPPQIKFTVTIPGADRIHHVNQEDVKVLLSRIPEELWERLRAVHFNDKARGARTLGYVNRGRRDIALCALPPRMSLTTALVKGQTCEQFGQDEVISGPNWQYADSCSTTSSSTNSDTYRA